MKKLFLNKKLVFSSMFAVFVIGIIVLNLTVFPEFLKITPEVTEIEKVTDEEIDVNKTNDVLGNVISEKRAIEIAKEGLDKEMNSSEPLGVEIGPAITDIDTAQIVARYVYEDASFPYNDPVWIVVFVSHKEDFTAPMPDEISIDDISEIAVEKGLVWEDENGNLTAYYEELTEYVIVKVNAVTGEYSGYKFSSAVNEFNRKDFAEWLNSKYNVDFELYAE